MDVFKKGPHLQRSSAFYKFSISLANYGYLDQDSSDRRDKLDENNKYNTLDNRTQHLSFQIKAAFPCVSSSKYKATKDNIIGIDLGVWTVPEEHRQAYIKPSYPPGQTLTFMIIAMFLLEVNISVFPSNCGDAMETFKINLSIHYLFKMFILTT